MKWEWPTQNEKWGRFKYIVPVILVGVLLLLLPVGEKTPAQPTFGQREPWFDLEKTERKLADTLSRIRGAGEVTVMLTLKDSGRQMLAQDVQKETESQQTTTVVLAQGSGVEGTVTVQDICPRYQGALVVCSGGADPQVKLELLGAVRALTGLSAEKISICKGQ